MKIEDQQYKIYFYQSQSGQQPIKKFLNNRRECPPVFSYCQENAFMFYHIYKKTDQSSQQHEIKIAASRLREYQESGICQ